MERTELRSAGCAVTSFTRSPSIYTSRPSRRLCMYSAPLNGRLPSAITSSGFIRVLLGRASLAGQFPPPPVEFFAVAPQRVLFGQQADDAPGLGAVHRDQ